MMGMYALSAVSVAIEHNFAGRKAKSEYIKEPLLNKVLENDGLTEEEIEEIEMRKELLAMEQWVANDRRRGLPETNIK